MTFVSMFALSEGKEEGEGDLERRGKQELLLLQLEFLARWLVEFCFLLLDDVTVTHFFHVHVV